MNEQVLKSSAKWKIISVICAAIFIIPCGLGEYWNISNLIKTGINKSTLTVFLMLQFVMIPFVILSILALLQVFRTYVKIRENEIEYFSGLIKRAKLPANKITGWSMLRQYTTYCHIVYRVDIETTKTLKIEMIYKNNELLEKWLKEHSSPEQQSLFNADETFPAENEINHTEPDDENLSQEVLKYKNIAIAYNYIGIALAILPFVLAIFLENAKNYVRAGLIFSTVWFFLGFILIKISREIITFDQNQGQKNPSITKGMLLGPAIDGIFLASCINNMVDGKKYFFVSLFISIMIIAFIRLLDIKQLQLSEAKTKI